MRLICAFACCLLGTGYFLLTGWYPDVDWLQAYPMSTAWPAAVVGGSLTFLILQWAARKGDAVQFLWSVFALAGCLLIIPLIVAREQQARLDRDADLSLREAKKVLRLKLLQMAQLKKEEQADRLERARTDRFVQYEGRLPDEMLDRLRALDKRMIESLEARSEDYRKALDANPTLGPDAWVRFRTLDQLEIELASHKALYEQTRSFTHFIESFEADYQQAITELDLRPPADRIAIAELERILQDFERTRIFQLRRLDVRLIGEAIKALSLLRDEWGAWSYDPRSKRLVLENPARQASFYESIQLIQAIIEEVRLIRESMDESE